MPKLETAASACERLDSIYTDVMNNVIKPPKANVLMKLTALKLELLDKKGVEEQIAKMESQIEELSLILAKVK
jgi:hypothetical protein